MSNASREDIFLEKSHTAVILGSFFPFAISRASSFLIALLMKNGLSILPLKQLAIFLFPAAPIIRGCSGDGIGCIEHFISFWIGPSISKLSMTDV